MELLEELLSSPVRPRAFDFRGSRAFIESLPSRRPFVLREGLPWRGRDIAFISTANTMPLAASRRAVPRAQVQYSPSNFTAVVDRRSWTPVGAEPAGELRRGAARVVAGRDPFPYRWDPKRGLVPKREIDWSRSTMPAHKLFFKTPSRVVECLKRLIRRQVLHAKGVAGLTGFDGMRHPIRRWSSSIGC